MLTQTLQQQERKEGLHSRRIYFAACSYSCHSTLLRFYSFFLAFSPWFSCFVGLPKSSSSFHGSGCTALLSTSFPLVSDLPLFFSADLHRQLDQSARQLAQSQVQAAQAAQALQALRTQLQQQEQQITDLQAAQAQHDKQVAELQSQLKEKEQQLKAQRDNQAQDEQVIRGERTRETDRRERCGVEQKRNG